MLNDDGIEITGQDNLQHLINSSLKLVFKSDYDMPRDDEIGMVLRETDLPRLSVAQCASLEAPLSSQEIKQAMFGLGLSKSPGPDGVFVEFFTTYWDQVGPSVVQGVRCFFNSWFSSQGTESLSSHHDSQGSQSSVSQSFAPHQPMQYYLQVCV